MKEKRRQEGTKREYVYKEVKLLKIELTVPLAQDKKKKMEEVVLCPITREEKLW